MDELIKNKLPEVIQNNSELKNTIKLEDTEYNINAAVAEVAKHTQANLTLIPSITGTESDTEYTFDGNAAQTIKYVPADGGKFTGNVSVAGAVEAGSMVINNDSGNSVANLADNEVVKYGQVSTIIKNLDGAPLYTWDVSTGYNAVTNTENVPYKLNTVVGKIEDLLIFEAYSEGKAHSKYIEHLTPDNMDTNPIADNGEGGVYFSPGYTSDKSKITKLVFKGTYNGKPTKLITITTNNKTIGAFEGLTALETVHINPCDAEIGQEIGQIAFKDCKALSAIAIPDSVSSIGKWAFENCEKLTSIILGSKITNIQEGTFKNSGLKSIFLCSSVKTIHSKAFLYCASLEKIYFAGTKADWDKVNCDKDTSVEFKNLKVTKAENTDPIAVPVICIDDAHHPAAPFLYICKGADSEDTSLTSNKMFLKLPGQALVEVSKGAARLERVDSKPTNNTGYFTYDVLAAIINGINSRITALAGQKLALPTTLNVSGAKHTAVPELPDDISSADDKPLIVKEDAVLSVQDLADAIEDLKISQDATLDGIAGKYTSKTVGGLAAGEKLNDNITLSGLLQQILGIKSGVAPSGFTFSINPSSITASLDKTSQSVTATWSVSNGGTYTGLYTPTIGGKTGTASKSGGTVYGITINFGESDTSKSVSGSVTYDAGTGFNAGSLSGGSKSLTINRTCYYGPLNGTLSEVARTSKANWNIKTTSAVNNDYFIFQYPKAWGKLSSVTDNDTGYEALTNSETFDKTPIEVTKNGGKYYQYKTNKPQNVNLNFTINS